MIGAFLLMLALVVSLAVAAFCAGAETGFLSVNRGRIVHLARAGSAAARLVEQALADVPRLVTGLLIGNNLAAVAFSSASAALLVKCSPSSTWGTVAWNFVAATTMLYFGEFLPKLFCSMRPLRRTLALAPCHRFFAAAMRPFTALVGAVSVLCGGRRPPPRAKLSPDDLLRILRDRKDGVRLTDFESALIARILVLRAKGEPVTPDSLLVAIDGE